MNEDDTRSLGEVLRDVEDRRSRTLAERRRGREEKAARVEQTMRQFQTRLFELERDVFDLRRLVAEHVQALKQFYDTWREIAAELGTARAPPSEDTTDGPERSVE